MSACCDRRHIEVGQAAGGEHQIVHPHRISVRLERAAHDPRQHDDQWLRSRGSLPIVVRCDLGRLLLELVEDIGVGLHQRGDNPACRIGVPEVVKMIDAATGVDPIANDAGPLGAPEHRRGINDEVVVFPVVEIGDQRLEAVPRGVSRKVATDDMQVGAGRLPGAIEHANQRRCRHLRFEPGEFLRNGALLDDGEQQCGRRVVNRIQPEAGNLFEHIDGDREVAVEAPVGKRRASGGTRDAHVTLDKKFLVGKQFAQRRKRIEVALAIRRAEQLEIAFVEWRAALEHRPTQELADQAAARVRHQMQARRIRERGCQFKRVLDGTLSERAMLEGKDLPIVGLVQLDVASAGAAFPEAPEAAVGGRRGAVDEDQNRLCGVELANRLQVRCARRSAAIEARPGLEFSFHLAADDVGDVAGDIDAEDFEPFDHPGSDAAACPAQGQHRGQVIAAGRSAANRHTGEIGFQGVGALPEPDASFEFQLDDVVVGNVKAMGERSCPRRLNLCAVLRGDLPRERLREITDARRNVKTTVDDYVCHEAPSPDEVSELLRRSRCEFIRTGCII